MILLSNSKLGVRRRATGGRDAHGAHLPTGWGSINGPLPGYLDEDPQAAWTLGLDPSLWPVRQGDLVIDGDTGAAFLVDTADLITHSVVGAINWILCAGHQRGNGGTEPGGAWFVNRYTPDVGPDPYRGEAGLFTGHGAPTADTPGLSSALPGDEYLDVDTGVVYQLGAS